MPAPASSTCRPARRRCCAARPASWCRTARSCSTGWRACGELEGTRFAFAETEDGAEATCPWGNRVRCHAPDPARFGPITSGIPYVEFDVPPGTVAGIARFYREILGAPAWVGGRRRRGARAGGEEPAPRVPRDGPPAPPFDGHHVQIALADFGGPYARLRERGLVSQEDSAWQYRFRDIVDLDTGAVLFTVEHEVRSMTHPMFARPLVNRNAAINNRNYAPGHEAWAWAHAAALRRRGRLGQPRMRQRTCAAAESASARRS